MDNPKWFVWSKGLWSAILPMIAAYMLWSDEDIQLANHAVEMILLAAGALFALWSRLTSQRTLKALPPSAAGQIRSLLGLGCAAFLLLMAGCVNLGTTAAKCYAATSGGTTAIESAAGYLESPEGDSVSAKTAKMVLTAAESVDAAADVARPLCLSGETDTEKAAATLAALTEAQKALSNALAAARAEVK